MKVESTSTTRLMLEFHQNLQSKIKKSHVSTAQALRGGPQAAAKCRPSPPVLLAGSSWSVMEDKEGKRDKREDIVSSVAATS